MKRSFALLLSAMLLVFSLTACGTDKNNNGSNTTGNNAADTNTNQNTGSSANGGTSTGQDLIDDARDDWDTVRDDVENSLTDNDANRNNDTLTNNDGTATKQRSVLQGATYGQMLRNGRVHDTDGDLRDFENTVTPGSFSW